MTFDFVASNSSKSTEQGAKVSKKVLARVQTLTEEGKVAAGAAQITIAGVEPTYVGAVALDLNGKSYTLTKGKDTHSLWAKHQGDNLTAFTEVFGILAENPDKYQGVIKQG